MPSATEIIPGLWLGNLKARSNLKFIKRKKIKLIVNCCSQALNDRYNIIPISISAGTRELLLDLSDRENDKSTAEMIKTLPWITREIDDCLNRGESVLVHCYAGRRRSPAIVMGYLMSKCGWSTGQSVQIVNQLWPYTINSFVRALSEYEIKLKDI